MLLLAVLSLLHPRPEPSMKRYKVPSFDMRALATIHHFTTSTALTFFDQPAYTLALQNVLPQIAMSQDFVMHGESQFNILFPTGILILHVIGLFALANLHLHVLKAPASGRVGGHFQVAEDHFQWALQGFAEANSSGLVPQLSDINLIFNQMVAMFMFARPVTDEPDLPIQDTIEFLLHTRSFYNALTAPWKAGRRWTPEVFAESLAFPAALANLHLPECGAPDPEEVRDPLVSQVYYEAIVGLMAGWTLAIFQDEFVSYLDQKRPRALVLMAHWCASIVQFKETWWIRERGEKDIRSILSYLDQRWLPWMTIPIEALNDPKQWVPPPPPLALEQQSMATTPLGTKSLRSYYRYVLHVTCSMAKPCTLYLWFPRSSVNA
ncbi:hypothetical protein DL96DRAFT_1714115 [Flagelloscypha sp. PMI_526]|nr:hypothetical protein DL96DRAFT_1714115 [Flagelloscypha sp. PMI_526]